MNSFGVWLKDFRQKRGWTQEKLSNELGFTAEYIRKLGSGRRRPTPTVAQRLAEVQGLQGSEYTAFINFIHKEFINPPANASQDIHNQASEDTGQTPAYLQIAQQAALLESAEPAPGFSPYKGLNFFDVDDAPLYFGRKQLITEVVSLLAEIVKGNSRFLAIIGASGSGKSSLARAGLVPAIQKGAINGNSHWLIKILTPTASPLRSLALALTEQEADSITAQMIDDLAVDERVLDLRASKLLATNGLTGSRLLLIIDQFEELFTLCKDAAQRYAYIDNLLTAAESNGPTVVLITLRADFYPHCLEYEALRSQLERHAKTIGAMNGEELHEAITGPAYANNWQFEAGLVDLFLDDVGDEPGALPLLAHALRETWERRRGRTLTLAGYSQIGRVQGAIATTAERMMNELSPTQQTTAQRIFLRLTELGEGSEDTRRRVPLVDLLATGEEQQVSELLQLLTQARLLTVHSDEAKVPQVEVAHEALIRAWPRLRTWLTENRENLRIHRRLSISANEWQNAHCHESLLYRGIRLEQARTWAQAYPAELSDQEQRFLASSQAAVEAAQKAEAEARLRELEQQRKLAEEEAKRAKLAEERATEREIAATRLKRARNILIAASIITLFLAGLASLFGLQSNQNATEANRQRVTAVAAQSTTNAALATAEVDRHEAVIHQSTAEAGATVAVAAQATAVVSARLANTERLAIQSRLLSASTAPNDLDLALILARQAVTTTLASEGRVLASADLALVEAIDAAQRNQWRTVFVLLHPAGVTSIAYSPDGQLLVSACDDAVVRLWDVASGKEIRQFAGHTASVKSAAFSSDGEQIISASEDGTMRLWEVATGQEIRQLPGHIGGVNVAAFSPDGRQIVSGGEDATVRLWDATDGTEIRAMIGHTATVNSAVFNPNNQQIVSAGADNTIRIWDLSSDKGTHQLTSPAVVIESATASYQGHQIVWSVDFSVDGKTIVTAGDDAALRVWDVANGKELRLLTGHGAPARTAAFHPDVQQIVSTSSDNTVRIWSVASEKLMHQLIGHTAAVMSATFRPDGKQIASASEDGTVRLWNEPTQQEVHHVDGHTGSVRSVMFNPTGEQLISASEDTTIRIWDRKSGQELRQLIGHRDSVRSAVFSPDSQQIVSASEDGTIRLWGVKSGQELRQLTGHEGAVWSAVFSPNGQQIASSGQDKTVRIWDMPTGQEVRQLTGHQDSVWRVQFSSDGQWLASACADGTILVWDVANGTVVSQLLGHGESTWSAVFSPDGQQIVSAGEDRIVRIWDVASGQEVRQLVGHTAGVRSAVFSPDGKQIVSASADKTIRFWDAASGKELRQLVGHGERILWVTYSPDGQQIASSSADTTIRLWTVSIDELLQQARSLIQRDPSDLTTEERQQYGLE